MSLRDSPVGRSLARIGAALILVVQIGLVVRAYGAPIDIFGFQMFPESSMWQADIVRETADGRRIPIDEPWPGGYRWGDLVTARGLATPGVEHHADAGIDATLFLLDHALAWVGANTPGDTETVRLVAEVTVRRNGGDAERIVLVGPHRSATP